MPPTTRQSTISFPKKKHITKIAKKLVNVSEESTSTSSSEARKALHNSNIIVGRQKELLELTEFLKFHLTNNSSGSLYISGLPGTGKTASVNYVIEQNNLEKYYHIVKINCTAFNSSKAVFKKICERLRLKLTGKTEENILQVLEKYLLSKHKPILLILDEIDQLALSKSQSVLYKIFEWPSLKNSKIVLIGIANAMDLTDRILPRLCIKVELKPLLLHFVPYTKEEISEILRTRLNEVGAHNMFSSGSIELISAKVAGTSGDIRRALNLGIRVIEMAEQKNSGEIQTDINSATPLREIRLNKFSKINARKSPCKGSVKEELHLKDFNTNSSPLKRKLNASAYNDKPDLGGTLPKKVFKNDEKEKKFLQEINFQKLSAAENSLEKVDSLQSIRTSKHRNDEENFSNMENNLDSKSTAIKSPVKCIRNTEYLRRSPRKLQFNIESSDVLKVVKTVFGNSKNLKQDEESSFPLHQKLLICTVLLVIKKGSKKDLNVGKLHQVYSKVCAKRGITAVDKSGFLFLCRQVEVAGILQIGKGTGMLAKVSLQWDEYEIANSLKDLHLLSSVINDTSCLDNNSTVV